MASSPDLPPLSVVCSGQLQLAIQLELTAPEAVADDLFLASDLTVGKQPKGTGRQRKRETDGKKRNVRVQKPKSMENETQSEVNGSGGGGAAPKASSAAQRRRKAELVPISSDGICTETSQFFRRDQPCLEDTMVASIDSLTAARRRRSWTPPADATVAEPQAVVIDLENEAALMTPKTQLRKGIEAFLYCTDAAAAAAATAATSGETRSQKPRQPQVEPRRKKIELIDMPFMINNDARRKTKAKGTSAGPVTITEISTTLFHAEAATTARDVVENRKRRTESPAKAKADGKRRRSKEKEKDLSRTAVQGVLPPQAAQRKLDEFELSFGTFSQIAYNKSPASSNMSLDQGLLDIESNGVSQSGCTRGGLWAASSRLDSEQGGNFAAFGNNASYEDLTGDTSTDRATEPKRSHKLSLMSAETTATAHDEASGSPNKNKSNKAMSSTGIVSIPSEDLSEPTILPTKPDFSQYTDARLAKEIRSYGFKPIKARAKMLALLEMCWESKNRLPLRSRAESNVPSSPSKADKPLEMPPSTPVHESVSQSATPITKTPGNEIIEIADSEDDSDPTPIAINRILRRASTAASSPKIREQSFMRSPENEDVETLITRAVRASPFYKSILVYDPQVIEELGLWLNTTGLRTVCNYDGEVGATELISWCRAQSVCWIYEKKRWHR